MKKLIALLIVLFSVILCHGREKFTLTSSDFKNDSVIPKRFTKYGENISPQLSWTNAPRSTKSFVISCIDTNPVAQHWVHWMIINIPGNISYIDQGASGGSMPIGIKELGNSFGHLGYGGPKPPQKTGVHDYVFTIYALNVESLDVTKRFISASKLSTLLKGKVIEKAVLTGKYEQKL